MVQFADETKIWLMESMDEIARRKTTIGVVNHETRIVKLRPETVPETNTDSVKEYVKNNTIGRSRNNWIISLRVMTMRRFHHTAARREPDVGRPFTIEASW